MEKINFSDKNIYRDKLKVCPLCSSADIQLHCTINRYSPPFNTDRCNACDFIFMNPRFNDRVLRSLYSENYYRGSAEYSYYDERDAEKYSRYVYDKRIKKIASYIKGGNLLDIGSAFGGFLKAVSGYFTPFGIEMSEYSGKYSKKIFGDRIHTGTLDNHPFKKASFSVVTMIEVLEHITEPVKSLEECYSLLERGGLLVIQTANMNAMQAKIFKGRYAYFMPGHISYFTKQNLKNVLLKTGFKKIKVFHPVEFGLLPKLLKSRYTFNSFLDYKIWIRIALYHFLSKVRFGAFAFTSSMVVYAFK